jgi:hypothetical protein
MTNWSGRQGHRLKIRAKNKPKLPPRLRLRNPVRRMGAMSLDIVSAA